MIYLVLFLMIFMLVGHLKFGFDWYIRPIIEVQVDEQVKTAIKAIFHYVSIMLILSTLYVFFIAFNVEKINEQLLFFIAMFYILSGVINFIYALKDKVGLLKMFQWILFFVIGILLLLI